MNKQSICVLGLFTFHCLILPASSRQPAKRRKSFAHKTAPAQKNTAKPAKPVHAKPGPQIQPLSERRLTREEEKYLSCVRLIVDRLHYLNTHPPKIQDDFLDSYSELLTLKEQFSELPCPDRFAGLANPIGLCVESLMSALALWSDFYATGDITSLKEADSFLTDVGERYQEVITALEDDPQATIFITPLSETGKILAKQLGNKLTEEEASFVERFMQFWEDIGRIERRTPDDMKSLQIQRGTLKNAFAEYKKIAVPERFKSVDDLLRSAMDTLIRYHEIKETELFNRQVRAETQKPANTDAPTAQKTLDEMNKQFNASFDELQKIIIEVRNEPDQPLPFKH